MKRVGCLFLPYFLSSLTIKANPRLRKQPVAIYREGQVVGVSPELKDQSIMGVSLNRARGLCPEAFFVEYDRLLHQVAQEQYLQMLSKISPLIEPLGEQECFLDLSGKEIEAKIEQMEEWLGGQGWGPVAMGMGANKLLARLATRVPYKKKRGKTPGFYSCTVEPGREKDFLERVPLDLDWLLPSRTVKTLGSLGFTRFGELGSLSLNDLLKVLGQDGYMIYQHSQGLDNTPLLGLYPPEKISCYFEFLQGVHNRNPLEKALAEGARIIASTLQERRMNCRRIVLLLELEKQTCRVERQVSRGCGEERRLHEIMGIMLRDLSWAEPVLGMMIEVSALYEWIFTEQNLFVMDKKSSRSNQDLNRAIEALEIKLPGMIRTGLVIDRREQVLSFWDPWRFREGSR